MKALKLFWPLVTLTLFLLIISWHPAQAEEHQCLHKCSIADRSQGCGTSCTCTVDPRDPKVGICVEYYDYPDYPTDSEPIPGQEQQNGLQQQTDHSTKQALPGQRQNALWGQHSQSAQQGQPFDHGTALLHPQHAQAQYLPQSPQFSQYPQYASQQYGGNIPGRYEASYSQHYGQTGGGGSAALLGVTYGIRSLNGLAQQYVLHRQMMGPSIQQQPITQQMPSSSPEAPALVDSPDVAPTPPKRTSSLQSTAKRPLPPTSSLRPVPPPPVPPRTLPSKLKHPQHSKPPPPPPRVASLSAASRPLLTPKKPLANTIPKGPLPKPPPSRKRFKFRWPWKRG